MPGYQWQARDSVALGSISPMSKCIVALIIGLCCFFYPQSGAQAATKTKKRQTISKQQVLPLAYRNKFINTLLITRSPGVVEIRDTAKNLLWVCKRSDLDQVYSDILPRELDKLLQTVDYHRSLGDHEAELANLEELTALLPKNSYLQRRIGLNHMEKSQFGKAQAALEKAVTIDPRDLDSRKELGIVYFYQKNYAKAAAQFSRAVKQINRILDESGFTQKGKFKKVPRIPANFKDEQAYSEYLFALQDRRQVLAQNLVLTYSKQADIFYHTDKQKQALTTLEKAMQLLPDNGGFMEKYRLYEIFSPTAITADKKKLSELEIWLTAVNGHARQGKIAYAIELLNHLKTIYPKEQRLVERSAALTLQRANALSGMDQFSYLLTAFEKDSRQTTLLQALAQVVEAIDKELHDKTAGTAKKELKQSDVEADLEAVKDAKLSLKRHRFRKLVQRFFDISQDKAALKKLTDLSIRDAKELIANEEILAAKQIIEEARRIDKDNAELAELHSSIHVALGKLLHKKGDILASIANYEQAIKSGKGTLLLRLKVMSLRLQYFITTNFKLIILILIPIIIIAIVSNHLIRFAARKRQLARLRRDGWQAYKREEWQEAIDNISKYIKGTRAMVQFSLYKALAESYANTEDHDSALLVYKKIGYLFPNSKCYLDEARIYIMQKRVTLLISCLKRSANLETDTRDMIDYCFNLIEEGQEETEKDLQEIIGSLYLLIKDLERSKYMFTQVVRHYTNDDLRFAYRQLVDIAKLEKDTDELYKTLSRYEKRYPDDAHVQFELGCYYERAGDNDKALKHLERSANISYSEHVERKINEIRRETTLKRLDEEMARLEKVEATPAAKLKLASLMYQAGKYADCIKTCSDLIAMGHNTSEALRLMGHSHYFEEDFDQAADCLNQYLKNNSLDEDNDTVKDARYRLGQSYLKQHLFQSAIHEFRTLFRTDADYRDVRSLVSLSLTTCPYCSGEVTTQDLICPHCESRIRHGSKSGSEIMLGTNQYASSNAENEVQFEPSELENQEDSNVSGIQSNAATDDDLPEKAVDETGEVVTLPKTDEEDRDNDD